MADLDALALALPHTAKDVSDEGRASYLVHGKLFCCQIPDLGRLDRHELEDLVAEAWLTRAQKRVAKAWLAEHGIQ